MSARQYPETKVAAKTQTSIKHALIMAVLIIVSGLLTGLFLFGIVIAIEPESPYPGPLLPMTSIHFVAW